MAVTSTVLDVTVLLLCVSASVVALGASDTGGPDGPTASDAADRLVTETATVTYSDNDAPNGTRRVHATRAELLALLVDRDVEGAFDRRATESVRTGLGPRTRVDVTVETDGESGAGDADDSAGDGGTWNSSDAPTAWGRRASYPHPIVGEAIPTWGVDGRERGDDTGGPRNSVAVGPEPPRNANVGVAVVRQPVPERVDRKDGGHGASETVVRIVVRRW
ncbi:DUF7284 family protein [Halorubrum sp. AS12]|uniref:DUF7284 family protein n=1 Tax=Halorubrum sp. AS12 TaxID=3409687 RepID=UPI003DA780D4